MSYRRAKCLSYNWAQATWRACTVLVASMLQIKSAIVLFSPRNVLGSGNPTARYRCALRAHRPHHHHHYHYLRLQGKCAIKCLHVEL